MKSELLIRHPPYTLLRKLLCVLQTWQNAHYECHSHMAHRTHLYAAISSGTVTAQTFEQLPTAIIKKKKKKFTTWRNVCFCSFGFFSSCPKVGFTFLRGFVLSDKLCKERDVRVWRKLSCLLTQHSKVRPLPAVPELRHLQELLLQGTGEIVWQLLQLLPN